MDPRHEVDRRSLEIFTFLTDSHAADRERSTSNTCYVGVPQTRNQSGHKSEATPCVRLAPAQRRAKSSLPLCSCFPKTARRVATECVRTEGVPAAAQQQVAGRRLRPHGARTAAGTLIVTDTERAKDGETGRDHGGRGVGMICSPHCTAASLAATACVSLKGRFFRTVQLLQLLLGASRRMAASAWRRHSPSSIGTSIIVRESGRPPPRTAACSLDTSTKR
jgi:hypothetical protein